MSMNTNTQTERTVLFLFDFGSPNAYLCHKLMPALAQRTGARLQYLPILLGGLFKLANNRSPIEAFASIPHKMAYEQLEMQRFIQRHGLVDFRMNPHFPVNTLPVMRGAVAAQALGCFDVYVNTVFAAIWEQREKMDDLAVVQRVLSAAGLDAAALLAATQQAHIKAQLMSNTQDAHDRGAFGSPTFFVGSEMFFGKERLEQVEEAVRGSMKGE